MECSTFIVPQRPPPAPRLLPPPSATPTATTDRRKRRSDPAASASVPGGGGELGGQWVTLSKSLLLQLVERICLLSFQSDMTSSSQAAAVHGQQRNEPEVAMTSRRAQQLGASPTTPETDGHVTDDTGSDVMNDVSVERAVSADAQQFAVKEEQRVMMTRRAENDDADDDDDDDDDAAFPVDVTTCEDDASVSQRLNIATPDDDSGRLAETTRTVRATSRGAGGVERRHLGAVRRRRLLRTRRRNLPTSSAQRRLALKLGIRAGGGRQRRSPAAAWMALSKDVVYGAIEKQLLVDGSSATPPEAVRSSAPSAVRKIWNPAICSTPSSLVSTLSRKMGVHEPPPAPVRVTAAACNVWRRDITVMTSPHRTAVASMPSESSMLSELLGFTSCVALPPPLPPPPPSLCRSAAAVSRQRHWSDGPPPPPPPPLVHDVLPAPESPPRRAAERALTSELPLTANYSLRPTATAAVERISDGVMSTAQRLWRPGVDSVNPASISGVVASSASSASPAGRRPRWVAVNKGDVCSLVDNLVSTMIAADDRTALTEHSREQQQHQQHHRTSSPSTSASAASATALPLSARCSVAATEPRKWKSDLLQRLRNEHH